MQAKIEEKNRSYNWCGACKSDHYRQWYGSSAGDFYVCDRGWRIVIREADDDFHFYTLGEFLSKFPLRTVDNINDAAKKMKVLSAEAKAVIAQETDVTQSIALSNAVSHLNSSTTVINNITKNYSIFGGINIPEKFSIEIGEISEWLAILRGILQDKNVSEALGRFIAEVIDAATAVIVATRDFISKLTSDTPVKPKMDLEIKEAAIQEAQQNAVDEITIASVVVPLSKPKRNLLCPFATMCLALTLFITQGWYSPFYTLLSIWIDFDKVVNTYVPNLAWYRTPNVPVVPLNNSIHVPEKIEIPPGSPPVNKDPDPNVPSPSQPNTFDTKPPAAKDPSPREGETHMQGPHLDLPATPAPPIDPGPVLPPPPSPSQNWNPIPVSTVAQGHNIDVTFMISNRDCGWVNESEMDVACKDLIISGRKFVADELAFVASADAHNASDLLVIGVASEQGTASVEKDRAEQRARNLAGWILDETHLRSNVWILNLGKYKDSKLSNDISQRFILIATIGGDENEKGDVKGSLIKKAMKQASRKDARFPDPDAYSYFELIEYPNPISSNQ